MERKELEELPKPDKGERPEGRGRGDQRTEKKDGCRKKKKRETTD